MRLRRLALIAGLPLLLAGAALAQQAYTPGPQNIELPAGWETGSSATPRWTTRRARSSAISTSTRKPSPRRSRARRCRTAR